ncbi:MAG: class I SAM-dependent methyltransferase [Planctomycetales bacterium]|nr:class I SAM-dependent methyltransferase [Planctomycetales bacterium]MCA9161680.1 class I SAM-dependent methyltransferase [Planctomycetales bacterium]MCA9203823.1 class I SAM-dependent methyltransferase [Planctomycetales bacterium]
MKDDTVFSLIQAGVRAMLMTAGYDIIPRKQPDFDDQDMKLVRQVAPYTMTSAERLVALRRAVTYLTHCGIEGAIVECGVWKGGSMMMAALTLLELDEVNREFYLYDTYEGMSAPTEADRAYNGGTAEDLLRNRYEAQNLISSLESVQQAMNSTKYHPDLIRYVKGKVEETIPATVPDRIALLRLDTDWYESTYHEMVHLYPRLVRGGVLIVDDYGFWQGSRKAIDQYIAEKQLKLLLNRVDFTARIAVKLEDAAS